MLGEELFGPDFAPELEPGATCCGGRYTVQRRIVRAGIATVYAATTRDGHPVALKVMESKRVAQHSHVERMENEMRIGAALADVSNIVRPIDHGVIPELGDRPFIAFDLEPGKNVRLLLSGDSLEPLKACRIARTIADTLAKLHARGVIHRDVKPSNILLDEGPEGLRVCLLDFGFAYSFGQGSLPDTSGVTMSYEITGTADYMAPEHCLGLPPDPSFDLYGLTSTLWHMTVGHPPYLGHRPRDIVRKKLDPTIPIPSIFDQLFAKLDDDLAWFIERGMKRDPKERIGTAEEFRDELDEIIARLSGRRGRTLPSATAAADVEVEDRKPKARWWPAASVVLVVLGIGIGSASSLRRFSAREPHRVAAVMPVGGVQRIEGEPAQAEERLDLPSTAAPMSLVGPARPSEPATSDASESTVSSTTPPPEKPPVMIDDKSMRTRPGTPNKIRKTPKPMKPKLEECFLVRESIREAELRSHWDEILRATTQRRECWPQATRTDLRLRAFRSLGRYEECIQEGTHAVGTENKRTAASCTTLRAKP